MSILTKAGTVGYRLQSSSGQNAAVEHVMIRNVRFRS